MRATEKKRPHAIFSLENRIFWKMGRFWRPGRAKILDFMEDPLAGLYQNPDSACMREPKMASKLAGRQRIPGMFWRVGHGRVESGSAIPHNLPGAHIFCAGRLRRGAPFLNLVTFRSQVIQISNS